MVGLTYKDLCRLVICPFLVSVSFERLVQELNLFLWMKQGVGDVSDGFLFWSVLFVSTCSSGFLRGLLALRGLCLWIYSFCFACSARPFAPRFGSQLSGWFCFVCLCWQFVFSPSPYFDIYFQKKPLLNVNPVIRATTNYGHLRFGLRICRELLQS